MIKKLKEKLLPMVTGKNVFLKLEEVELICKLRNIKDNTILYRTISLSKKDLHEEED